VLEAGEVHVCEEGILGWSCASSSLGACLRPSCLYLAACDELWCVSTSTHPFSVLF